MSDDSLYLVLDVHLFALLKLWVVSGVAFPLKALGKKPFWKEILCEKKVAQSLYEGGFVGNPSFSVSAAQSRPLD